MQQQLNHNANPLCSAPQARLAYLGCIFLCTNVLFTKRASLALFPVLGLKLPPLVVFCAWCGQKWVCVVVALVLPMFQGDEQLLLKTSEFVFLMFLPLFLTLPCYTFPLAVSWKQTWKGFGYVTFKDKDGLLQGLKMTGLNLGGRNLRVEVAKPQRGGNRRGESSLVVFCPASTVVSICLTVSSDLTALRMLLTSLIESWRD